MNNKTKDISICNWCGKPTEIIWVHGHGQCKYCGINIDECCRGETCIPSNEVKYPEKTVSKKLSSKN